MCPCQKQANDGPPLLAIRPKPMMVSAVDNTSRRNRPMTKKILGVVSTHALQQHINNNKHINTRNSYCRSIHHTISYVQQRFSSRVYTPLERLILTRRNHQALVYQQGSAQQGPGQHQMLIDSISLLLAVRQSSSCTLVFMPTDGLFHASLAVQRNFFDAGGAGMQSQ